MQKIYDTIFETARFLGLNPKLYHNGFIERTKIPRNVAGIYIICDSDKIVYVGKGNVRARHKKHLQKMKVSPELDPSMPQGWKHIRTICGDTWQQWQFICVDVPDLLAQSAMEGVLIYKLKPTVNYENFVQQSQINQLGKE